MNCCHLSDTHGTFPPLGKSAELILHSGDFCPNFIVTDRIMEAHAQAHWLHNKRERIRRWLEGRRLILTQGNHDFTSIVGPGIDDITNASIEVAGYKFYGMPWVPAFGPWNWGTATEGLKRAFDAIPLDTDILLAHCPPLGILDECPNGHIGNPALDASRFKYVLCGHVHEQGGGIQMVGDCSVLNNATTMREFILPTDKRQQCLFVTS